MSHPMTSVIDRILQRAEARGDFDGLPGAGQPLPRLDNPADAVMHRLMTESRVKPPVVELQEQICAARARLSYVTEATERKAVQKTLADLQTRLALELEAFRTYG